jgi:CubicO group peptidase (beta-lactamase class C family)
MNRKVSLCLWAALIVALCAGAMHVASAAAARAQSAAPAPSAIAVVSPETVGFSSERLERLHAEMREIVEQKKEIPGMVTILARHGKVVDYRAYGVSDVASNKAMAKDEIFRAFSMTKPVTGVAMMILYEEGKWLPSDPISKYVPEFAHLRVFKGVDASGNMITEEPVHAPTMAELMTHTAGFTYGLFMPGPVDDAYRNEHIVQSKSLQEMIDKLAQLPLAYQPGTRWNYSVSVDIQGYIIEKISGKSLPDFMREHIFQPLGMKDTGFYVPAEKRSRLVTLYRMNAQDQLEEDKAAFGLNYTAPPTMPSGGGGLVTTAQDYYRFAQMLGNDGELGGVRILAPATVHLMGSNHLAPALLTGEFGVGAQIMRAGMGYGYDCAVEYDPAQANLIGGAGTFFWDGAAGTWFWVDPQNDVVFVAMVQRLMDAKMPNAQYLSRPLVYQALMNPEK